MMVVDRRQVLRLLQSWMFVWLVVAGCTPGRLDDGSNDAGVDGGPCPGACDAGWTCVAGSCVSIDPHCQGVDCPAGTRCDRGACVAIDLCDGMSCPNDGEVCQNGLCVSGEADSDGDGFTARVDCDDSEPEVYPGAVEVCNGRYDACDDALGDGADECPGLCCGEEPACRDCCDASSCGGGDWTCSGEHRCECSGMVCGGECVAGSECCTTADCPTNWTCGAAGQCICECTDCDGTCYGSPPCCEFADVPVSHTFHDEISAICDAGITHGCGDGANYCPTDPLTRETLAVLLVNALFETPSDASETAYFDDISGLWTSPYINRIYELDLTSGCGTRLYCPSDIVTRRIGAVFLVKALGETESLANSDAHFDDLEEHFSTSFVNRLFELDIARGCGTRLFCPNEPLTRAQVATFLARGFLCF